MTDSLFSALRIIAMMLIVDRKVDTRERVWFMAVMNNFGATYSQRGVLRDHLRGRNREDLNTLFKRITDEYDKKRLLNFLKVAMNLDGEVTAEEKDFYQHVKALAEKVELSIDYTDYGRSLLQRDRDLRLWNAFDEGGQLIRKGARPFIGAPYMDSLRIASISMTIAELIWHENRKTLWIILTLTAAVFFIFC